MEKQKMTEKQMAQMYTKVMKDDTYWDDMTAAELEKRLDDFNAHKKGQGKLVALISCLRLAPCVYLRERTDGSWSIPIIPIPDSPVFMVFTSVDQIKSENLKVYETDEGRLPDILESVELDENAQVVINPDSQAVILPLNLLNSLFDAFEDIVEKADEQMAQGIAGDALDEEIFEHFFCRTIECETLNGEHIKGDAFSYDKDKRLGSFFLVDAGADEPKLLTKSEVKFIKDITPWDEEDDDGDN